MSTKAAFFLDDREDDVGNVNRRGSRRKEKPSLSAYKERKGEKNSKKAGVSKNLSSGIRLLTWTSFVGRRIVGGERW